MSALFVERVAQLLATQRYGRSLVQLASTASTNDDARRAAEQDVSAGHVIVADAQTQGRGARARSWSSPAGLDLYLSIVDRLPVQLAELPPLTLAVGLGVASAVDALLGGCAAPSQVKWPNDVLISGRKCAGILLETQSGLDAVVIGIGLNVNRREFSEELRELATSLAVARGGAEPFDRNQVLATLLGAVERSVDRFVAEGAAAIASALTARLAWVGQPARCGDLQGIVRGVDAQGALLIETARGIERAIAGRLEPLPAPG